MLTRTVAILLLFCSVSFSLSGLLVFAGFEMNRSYIANELCVNKNRPELHCNGKCYLMKKLKQAQDKEQKEERQFQKVQLLQPSVALSFRFQQYAVATRIIAVPQCTGQPVAQIKSIFHPPKYS